MIERLLFAISQRYYIESNSQPCRTLDLISIAVCYLAKILHWKQFTTISVKSCSARTLFAISQRYYIESNSQLWRWISAHKGAVCYLAKILHWKQFTTYQCIKHTPAGCLLSRKDTTLKAIHNDMFKFTQNSMLFAISQRYYIESNSQQANSLFLSSFSCLLSRKDTTLKAIHNLWRAGGTYVLLFAISQRYYIESNSQQRARRKKRSVRCLLSRKDTTLKAIHNPTRIWTSHFLAVCYLAKILHWKQFTTIWCRRWFVSPLFAISQRYYIESNSQQVRAPISAAKGCLLSRKDTTLKAIHNSKFNKGEMSDAVCYLAKILHWKQFTTRNVQRFLKAWLFAISQRYYIESNSQLVVGKASDKGGCLLSRKDTTLKAIHNRTIRCIWA